MSSQFRKVFAPLAAIGLAAAVSACSWSGSYNGFDGVPLAELDMSGEAPTGIALAGPDRVILIEGDTLDIDVEASAEVADQLRFNLEGGTLGIGREGQWDSGMDSSAVAIIRVTMPAPTAFELAGSGSIESPIAAENVAVDIAGSGTIAIARLAARDLKADIAGSGVLRAAGTADYLELDIAGSGRGALDEVKVGDAKIDIAGSGNSAFASDGTVEGDIAGSGTIVVTGSASCNVEVAGSGGLTCRPAAPAQTAES